MTHHGFVNKIYALQELLLSQFLIEFGILKMSLPVCQIRCEIPVHHVKSLRSYQFLIALVVATFSHCPPVNQQASHNMRELPSCKQSLCAVLKEKAGFEHLVYVCAKRPYSLLHALCICTQCKHVASGYVRQYVRRMGHENEVDALQVLKPHRLHTLQQVIYKPALHLWVEIQLYLLQNDVHMRIEYPIGIALVVGNGVEVIQMIQYGTDGVYLLLLARTEGREEDSIITGIFLQCDVVGKERRWNNGNYQKYKDEHMGGENVLQRLDRRT